MSQLKHRIAVGKIVNGEWKFDHYADQYEMIGLKPKADESGVEKITRLFEDDIKSLPKDAKIFYSNLDEALLWKDVSDTHRIEWGDTFEDSGDIYENDILRVSTGDSFIDMIVSFERGTFRLHNIDWTEHETMQDMDGYKPISNTHIYPNFLEVT